MHRKIMTIMAGVGLLVGALQTFAHAQDLSELSLAGALGGDVTLSLEGRLGAGGEQLDDRQINLPDGELAADDEEDETFDPWEYWDSDGVQPDCDPIGYTTYIHAYADQEDFIPRRGVYTAYTSAAADWNGKREDWINGFEPCPTGCEPIVTPEPISEDVEGGQWENRLPTAPPGASNLFGPTFCMPIDKIKYGQLVHRCWASISGHVNLVCAKKPKLY